MDVLGEILSRQPENFKALNLIAVVYDKLNLPDKVVDALVNSLQIHPATFTVWKYVSEFVKLGGKLDTLVEALYQAIGLYDLDNQARIWIAGAYYNQ